jgi:transcriptional regulator with XRE-family HTH domain
MLGMTARERSFDRGRRRGQRLLDDLIADARDARISANVTQRHVGDAIGLSDSRISLIERGEFSNVPFIVIAEYLSVVGLELSARAYPVGGGVRDAGQLRLLERFRALVSPLFAWRVEVPMPMSRDLRAWDAGLIRDSIRIGIDAETRLRDIQAVDRRVMLKLRDSGWERAVLLIAGTRGNRAVVRAYGDALRANYPVPQVAALRALAAGVDPGGNCMIVV